MLEKSEAANYREAALEYLDGLYGYAMVLTRDHSAAGDLVQETYLRAASRFERLRADSNLKAWLYTILRNIHLNHVRHRQSGPQMVDIEDPYSGTSDILRSDCVDPLSSYIGKIQQRDVRRAIESLSPRVS